jgi:hypothetical protein
MNIKIVITMSQEYWDRVGDIERDSVGFTK